MKIIDVMMKILESAAANVQRGVKIYVLIKFFISIQLEFLCLVLVLKHGKQKFYKILERKENKILERKENKIFFF